VIAAEAKGKIDMEDNIRIDYEWSDIITIPSWLFLLIIATAIILILLVMAYFRNRK
jgi:hypothetical protein